MTTANFTKERMEEEKERKRNKDIERRKKQQIQMIADKQADRVDKHIYKTRINIERKGIRRKEKPVQQHSDVRDCVTYKPHAFHTSQKEALHFQPATTSTRHAEHQYTVIVLFSGRNTELTPLLWHYRRWNFLLLNKYLHYSSSLHILKCRTTRNI